MKKRGLWRSKYIFSTWKVIFLRFRKVYWTDVKVRVDPVAVRPSLVFWGWDMEADIMKTEFKAVVKDLSWVQKWNLTGQLNYKQSISTPETDPPTPQSAESQIHAACIFSQAFLWKLVENWHGINSGYILLCKQVVEIQNLEEDAGKSGATVEFTAPRCCMNTVHYTPCQHASAVHDGLLLCFYWMLSLSHVVFQSFISPPADITAPTARLDPDLQRASVPAFHPSWDAFPWGHSQRAQQLLCPHIRKLWEVCGG